METFLLSVIDKGQLQILAYLCGANFALGTLAALLSGKFEVVKLKDFWKKVLLTFGAYASVAIAAKGLADFDPLLEITWVALIGYLAAQLVSNLKDLGLPIPDSLSKYIEK